MLGILSVQSDGDLCWSYKKVLRCESCAFVCSMGLWVLVWHVVSPHWVYARSYPAAVLGRAAFSAVCCIPCVPWFERVDLLSPCWRSNMFSWCCEIILQHVDGICDIIKHSCFIRPQVHVAWQDVPASWIAGNTCSCFLFAWQTPCLVFMCSIGNWVWPFVQHASVSLK
jgi:hypothetical protein